MAATDDAAFGPNDDRMLAGYESHPPWTRHTKVLADRYENDFKLAFKGKEIIVKQENVIEAADIGNTVWDGALALAKYLEVQGIKGLVHGDVNRTISSKKTGDGVPMGHKPLRVVELGAGTGVCGLALAAMFGGNEISELVMTDLAKFLPLLRRSCACNTTVAEAVEGDEKQENGVSSDVPNGASSAPQTGAIPSGVIRVAELDWSQCDKHVPPLSPPFDVVIAAECIYFLELVPHLLAAVKALSGPDTLILASFEHHKEESVQLFHDMFSEAFDIAFVSLDDMHPVYRSTKIDIVRMRKRRGE